MVRYEIPLKLRASWFSSKCVEAQRLTRHQKVKHCFGVGCKNGTQSRQTLNTKYDPKITLPGTTSEPIRDKLHRRERNIMNHQLGSLNDCSVIKEVGVLIGLFYMIESHLIIEHIK